MTTGIYQIRNTANGFVCIGSSIDIERRLQQHLMSLRGGYHYNKKMQADASKYDIGVFVCSILEILPDTSTEERLFEREEYYTIQAHQFGKCYNPLHTKPRGKNPRSCAICGWQHYGQGLCSAHWGRWRKLVKNGSNISAQEYITLTKEGKV
jgi:hypothetical protein